VAPLRARRDLGEAEEHDHLLAVERQLQRREHA